MNVENLKNKNDPVLSSPAFFPSAPCEVSTPGLVLERARTTAHAAVNTWMRCPSGPGTSRPPSGQAAAPGGYALKSAGFWQEQEKALQKFGYRRCVVWSDAKPSIRGLGASLARSGAGCAPGARAALVPVRCRGRRTQPRYLPPSAELKSSESSINALLPLAFGQRPSRGSAVDPWDPAGVQGPACERSPAPPPLLGILGRTLRRRLFNTSVKQTGVQH